MYIYIHVDLIVVYTDNDQRTVGTLYHHAVVHVPVGFSKVNQAAAHTRHGQLIWSGILLLPLLREGSGLSSLLLLVAMDASMGFTSSY